MNEVQIQDLYNRMGMAFSVTWFVLAGGFGLLILFISHLHNQQMDSIRRIKSDVRLFMKAVSPECYDVIEAVEEWSKEEGIDS